MRNDWEIKRIGDFCSTSAGGTPLKSHKDYYENGTIPWLRSGEVGQGEILESENFITQKGLNNSSAKLFPKDSVLVAMYGATAGEVGILRFEAATNQAVCAILPNDSVSPKYLYSYLVYYKEKLVAKAIGNAQSNLSQTKIKDIKIPLPPLEEQKRIVSILNDAFAAIDRAKANIERNIENADELFQSKINEAFSSDQSNWVESRLADSFRMKSGDYLPKKDMVEGMYSVYGGNGITGTHEEYNLSGKQVLVGRVGAQCGNVHLTNKKLWLTDNAFRLTDFKYDFDFNFLKYLLEYKDLRKTARHTAQPVISNSSCKDVLLIFPKSLEAQKKIASHISKMEQQKKAIVGVYQKKIQMISKLKKSILQQAFEGELTKQKELVT